MLYEWVKFEEGDEPADSGIVKIRTTLTRKEEPKPSASLLTILIDELILRLCIVR